MVKNQSRRYRLNDEQAIAVGREINDSGQYRLTEQQEELLFSLDSETDTEPTKTKTPTYKPKHGHFTAIGDDGRLMGIEKYCDHYGLDHSKVRSFKLVTHTAIPFYNIAFYETVLDTEIDSEEFKAAIEEELKDFKYIKKAKPGTGTACIKISDLHFGAFVENLLKTQDFSIEILRNDLRFAAERINRAGYKRVHIHLLGDLIESFTGLNHKNTWKGIDNFTIGSKAVKMCAEVLHKDFLSQINNLGDVKIVAGNHDRVTSDKGEDTKGEAADLIAWGLHLIGYNVEFHPLVIKHIVDGICHILMHGDKPISKKSAEKICWDYGEQGMFNLITLGHLHATIQKLTIKQKDNFNEVEDEAQDHIKMHCPSFFSGNEFSENLGFTTRKGFLATEDNGKGIPDINNLAL